MGKNNKARRAAKAKARKAGQRGGRAGESSGGYDDSFGTPFRNPFGDPSANPFGDPTGGRDRPFEPPRRSVPEMRWEAMEAAARRKDDFELEKLAERMMRDDPVAGPRFAEQLLMSYVDQLWRHGWQPAEVVRQVRRKATKAAAQVVELAIHADHARRSGQAIDSRWSDQLAELGGRRIPTRDGWLMLWITQQGHDEAWAAIQVAKALAAIGYLPVVDTLIPPPGRQGRSVRGLPSDTGAEDPILRRVRKLLAKAESTSYDDEADSLTAKAQELMTKHAIDQALLDQDRRRDDVPGTIRVPIDAPYADAKSLLLQLVASGHRCRSIYLDGLGLSSVVGYAGDLRAVELIFTSLLVQAQHALAAAGGGAHARTRRASYRSAFYLAYAHRIGERLRSVTDEVLAEAGDGAHLPVLRAREDAVQEAFEQWYGESVTSSAVRGGYDSRGHAHGRQAADAARFGSQAIEEPGA
ncbi:MAG: aromatic acid decarboxylase [Pimelobacter sp.]|nr:aromatic acid decarboxylase [Pimelobacter sp.]